MQPGHDCPGYDWLHGEAAQMWRAFFLAMGIALMIVGAESLAVEQAVLLPASPSAKSTAAFTTATPSAPRVIKPAEWWPWTFMSTGAIVVLYSFTIPRRMAA